MPRMKILNSVEREVFDFPPVFNSVERKRCFDFPTPLQAIATSLRTASNQLVFLLSCGYFKATKRFYPVPTFHRRDLTYVADRIAVTLEGIDLTDKGFGEQRNSYGTRSIIAPLLPNTQVRRGARFGIA